MYKRQGQPVENPRTTLLDGQILVLAAQDIRLIEEAQRLKMAAMLLVELVPLGGNFLVEFLTKLRVFGLLSVCLLYTSDAADEEDSVDLGGRRIIKKKKKKKERDD